MRLMSERVLVGAALVLSLISLGLQAFVLRPRLWPAGAGLALSGDTVFAPLAAPRPVEVIRLPDVGAAFQGANLRRVRPGSPAALGGLSEGDQVVGVHAPPILTLLSPDPGELLRVWRDVQKIPPDHPLALDGFAQESGIARVVTVERPAIWAIDGAWGAWLRVHLGPLAQTTAFLAGATVLVLLGAHGTTATLMTLALIVTAAANGGPLLGAHQAIPVIGPLLLWFNWLVTPVSFPIIGLAVLFFP